ncbi:MAG: hypothetical protein M3N32_10920 [Actinomycetota bacterium]|nr:hypothetical protein [Actinomycetota bacterium]
MTALVDACRRREHALLTVTCFLPAGWATGDHEGRGRATNGEPADTSMAHALLIFLSAAP